MRLEPYRGPHTRFICPNCKRKGEFVRYIDENGRYYGEDIGRCNREIKCGYHKKPNGPAKIISRDWPEEDEMSIMGLPTFEKYRTTENNALYSFFRQFDIDTDYMRQCGVTDDILYHDGVVYWEFVTSHIIQGAVRIRYREGRRRHDCQSSYINRVYGYGPYHRKYPFGYSRIRFDRPVFVVESQKTAVVMGKVFNNFDWVATCGSGIEQIAKNLQDIKDVVLCPDTGKEHFWVEIAKKYGWKVLKLPVKGKNNYDILDYYIENGRCEIEI